MSGKRLMVSVLTIFRGNAEEFELEQDEHVIAVRRVWEDETSGRYGTIEGHWITIQRERYE